MTTRAKGTFDVKLNPRATEDATLGQLSIDKQLHGDLEGTSKGEMLTAGTTGQLAGLAGTMAITITDGKHFYEFKYTIAQTP